MPVKVRDAIRALESDGWFAIAAKDGHRQYKHPTKRGRVTIPGKRSDTLAPKTWASIRAQAGL